MSAVKAAWRTVVRLQGIWGTLDDQEAYDHKRTQEALNSIVQEWSLDENKLQKLTGVPPFVVRSLLDREERGRNPSNRNSPHTDELSQRSDMRKLVNGLLAYFSAAGGGNSSQPPDSSGETSVVRLQIILVSQASLNLLLELREHVRGNNFDPENVKQQKLQSIDDLVALVREGQEIQTIDEQPVSAAAKSWGARFRSALFTNFAETFEPENLAGATIPTSIILTCSTLGSLIAGPVGLGAGGVLGHILTRQLKPGQAADKLQETFAQTDPKQAVTPD